VPGLINILHSDDTISAQFLFGNHYVDTSDTTHGTVTVFSGDNPDPGTAFLSFYENPSTYMAQYTLQFVTNPPGYTLTQAIYTVDTSCGAVPLPPSVLMFGSGLLGLVGVRFRRVIC
jgi:hypothetical protein